jgi:hypothetical protein
MSPGPRVTATWSTSPRVASDRCRELEVPARGHLGNDAAVAGVELGLGGDNARQHVPVVEHAGGRRLVAGGLEREDHAPLAAVWRIGSFHIT